MKSRADYCDDCNSTCDECQYNTVTGYGERCMCGECVHFVLYDDATHNGKCEIDDLATSFDDGCHCELYKERSMYKQKYQAKADNGKLQIRLVPTRIIEDIAEVRMYGNKKYGSADNWKQVEMERYVDALMRHTLAFLRDRNSIDEESGIPHYKHMACNMAFICEMMRGEKNE